MAEINENVEKILINTDNNSLIFEAGGTDTSFDLISLWDRIPTDGGSTYTSVKWDAVVPEGVKGIKQYLFSTTNQGTGVRYLTSISLPSTLEDIDTYAFRAQTLLASITCAEGGPIDLDTYVFDSCSALADVSETFWDRLSNIAANCFSGGNHLSSFKIGLKLAAIGNNAFNAAKSLASVTCDSGESTVGSTLSLGNYAFRNCTALTSVTLPYRTSSISGTAFSGCTNLTSITIHKSQDAISGAPWGATNATVVWDG